MEFTKVEDTEETEDAEEMGPPKSGCLIGAFRFCLILVAMGLIGLAFAPSILSSDSTRESILKRVNAALAPASLTIRSWSFGWWSDTSLREITYSDPTQGLDCSIAEVQSNHGFWHLLPIGPLSLGRVTVAKPLLAFTPPKQVMPLAHVAKNEPATKQPGSFFLPVTGISGTFVIEGGKVTAKRPDAKAVEVGIEHAEVEVPAFTQSIHVKAKLLAGGGRLEAEGKIPCLEKLAQSKGVALPDELQMKLANVDLAECQALAPGLPFNMSGRANGTMDLSSAGLTQVKLVGDWTLTAFSVDAGNGRSKPGTAKVAADLDIRLPAVKIRQFSLRSPWLTAGAQGELGFNIIDQSLLGEVTGAVDADLAAITRDFRPLLALSDAFAMKSGRLLSSVNFHAKGGDLSVDGICATTNLQASAGGVPLVLQPSPSLTFAVTQHKDGTYEIKRLHLRAPFAEISAAGKPEAIAARGEVNLTRFRRDFAKIFKQLPPMVGKVGFNLASQQGNDSRSLSGEVTAQDLVLELQPGRRTVIDKGRLDLALAIRPNAQQTEFGPSSFKLATDGVRIHAAWKHLTLSRKGDAKFPAIEGLSAEGTCDLRGIRNLLGGVLEPETLKTLRRYEDLVTFSAAGTISEKTINLSALHLKDKYGTLNGASIRKDENGLDVKSLQVLAPFANIKAAGKLDDFTAQGECDLTNFQETFGNLLTGLPTLSGNVDFMVTSRKAKNEWDVLGELTAKNFSLETGPGHRTSVAKGKYTLGLAIPLNTKSPETGPGALTIESDGLQAKASWKRLMLSPAGAKPTLPTIDKLAAQGTTDVKSLSTLLGSVLTPATAKALQNYDDRFKFSFSGDLGGDRISFSPFDIKGQLGALQSDGQLTDLFGQRRLTAKGSIALDFDRVTQLLKAADRDGGVTLHGKTTKPFSIDAPVAGSIDSLFTDGTFEAVLGLESLTYRGVQAGASDVATSLKNGVLRAAYEPTLAEGHVKLNPEMRLERGVAVMTVPGETQLAKDVQITQQLVDQFLVRANPFFKGTAVSSGRFSTVLHSFTWITGRQTPDKGLKLTATLTVRDLQAQPGPQLAELFSRVKLRNGTVTVKKMDIDIAVKNARIFVSPFTVEVDHFPVTFGGSVGFDDSVDYYVEVPITDRLIGRKGDWVLNGNKKLRIPMTGTLENPQVNYEKLTQSVGEAVSDTIKENTENFLNALRQQLNQ